MPLLDQIDPIAVSLGPLKVHWYGLMYLLGFAVAWWLGARRARTGRLPGVNEAGFSDLMFYTMLGVVLGGRIGRDDMRGGANSQGSGGCQGEELFGHGHDWVSHSAEVCLSFGGSTFDVRSTAVHRQIRADPASPDSIAWNFFGDRRIRGLAAALDLRGAREMRKKPPL